MAPQSVLLSAMRGVLLCAHAEDGAHEDGIRWLARVWESRSQLLLQGSGSEPDSRASLELAMVAQAGRALANALQAGRQGSEADEVRAGVRELEAVLSPDVLRVFDDRS